MQWVAWLCVCVIAGVALGLATLPGSAGAEPSPPSGLRDAAIVATAPSFSPRRDTRLRAADARRRDAPPRIAVVIDDLGLSQEAFERINALPGPLTLAFLPYGQNAQAMLDAVRPGHEAILHLPAEPETRIEDAGPDMLRVGPADEIRETLGTNLAKLSGFDGVNNHTGSRFTADEDAMRVLLSELDAEGLYFLDSVTTPRPVSIDLGADNGWRVAARDIFLDDDYAGGAAAVRAQLAEVERIARAEGQAIAIGHPYAATAQALGPWLVTAQARGFELVTVGQMTPAPGPPALAKLR